jgi:hypothetical protein
MTEIDIKTETEMTETEMTEFERGMCRACRTELEGGGILLLRLRSLGGRMPWFFA